MTADKQRKRTARNLAAATGISYTAALRHLTTPAGPATGSASGSAKSEPASAGRAGWDQTVVDGLSDIVRSGQAVPVHVADVGLPPRGEFAVAEKWGVAEATVDGYVVRPVAFPNAGDLADAGVREGARVPVPYRTDDGEIAVAAVWPLVTRDSRTSAGWWWVHNGWPVDQPGDLHEIASPIAPSPDLPYEVRVWHAIEGLLGADYGGSAAGWETKAWCADADSATELADAFVAHRLHSLHRPLANDQHDAGYLRAEVHQHAPADRAAVPRRIHRVDADPARPVVPKRPFGEWSPGRPACTEVGPEPTWWTTGHKPPNYELKVWTATAGWRSFGWFSGRQNAGIAATMLRIGVAGAPYAYGETIGPRYPRAWAHDWTQHGRALTDYHPDMPYAEELALRTAFHEADHDG